MCSLYGIYIPDEEVLKRTKYQWFARIYTLSQVLKGNTEAKIFINYLLKIKYFISYLDLEYFILDVNNLM